MTDLFKRVFKGTFKGECSIKNANLKFEFIAHSWS